MFLKRIELFGFKSFPDRTTIEFPKGVGALIGPNGCGKSNVVDSIKWVLGEQSSKTLRASKMEDVIFNGTETRKPLSVAEVTLILSNDDGLLPLEMSEIVIKRRLYRSGESEYYVNNKSAKLKEVRELFYDTGIGKSAYSIMEQGKIDQVLSTKPDERRYIFEEAAGITKYKVRGLEAERKLAKTEENMKQIDGILGEVRKNYNTLKKQAEKTENYRKLKKQLFDIEVDIQLLKLRNFENEKENKQKELDEQINLRKTLQDKIDTINESMENNIDLVNNMESNLIEKQKILYGIDLEKNNKDSQSRILKDRLNELNRKITNDKEKISIFEEKIKNLNEEKEKKNGSIKGLNIQIIEITKNIEGFKKDIQLFF